MTTAFLEINPIRATTMANDESNLFYNMLGDRSVNSMESDSVDFNEMYDIHTGASSMDEESSTGARSKMDSVGGLCGGE
jgi:hypothetical protein